MIVRTEDLAYAAGIIDGEGSITISRRTSRITYRAMIRVEMCDDQAIQLLLSLFGGSLCTISYLNPKHRPRRAWCIAAIKARHCAELLLPYLRIKRQQALNLVQLQQINEQIRFETRIQRSQRRMGMSVPQPSNLQRLQGRYHIDPILLAECEELYQQQARLNHRGSAPHVEVKKIVMGGGL